MKGRVEHTQKRTYLKALRWEAASLLQLASFKKYALVLVKNGKASFTKGHHDRYREHCNGILQWRREISLNSEYSVGRCWFLTSSEPFSEI